ncbi:MAG: VCBS repeat-containing protein, partial [Bacteroidota bacterium]
MDRKELRLRFQLFTLTLALCFTFGLQQSANAQFLAPVASGLPGGNLLSIDFGDMDNDGDLDAVVCGTDNMNGPFADVYEFDNGMYTALPTGNFNPVLHQIAGHSYNSVEWGDVNNDNRLDFIIIGEDDQGFQRVEIYRNEGNNGFFNIFSLPGGNFFDVEWADADNDG